MDDAVPLATTASPPHAVPPTAGVAHTLLRHTTAMFEGVDEFAVLGAARAAMAALGPFVNDAAYLLHNGLPVRCAPFTPAVSGARPHAAATARATGHPDGAGDCWMRVYALRDRDRCLGYLVVRARTAPSADEAALADLLVRQAGIALAWMARRRLERATAEEHDRLMTAEIRRDADPSATAAVLKSTGACHEALARAAASGQGEAGIVWALNEVTGLPALTEDLFGSLRVWAGPGQPPPPPGPDLGPRKELLQLARHQSGAVRDRERLIAPIAMADLGTHAGAIGVGGRCDSPAGLPHSYDEAARALTVRRRSHDPYGSTNFEELGLYRMMGAGDGEREADRFVREWLGALLDYDARHHTDLVTTLSRYLESGGSYDATSEILLIHRSTVRYRLQRIREITGHDLSDVETRLNLHVATRIRNVFHGPR
ncbi:hypothetical protein ABIA33_007714 [Streptacidiphilus sp. MAP12-16]|uniref:PucR family transcriptional regulator n=1 Tax=Streptacidiphilus sp. MAP12-16 TaxID=3156300 RepID=UPI0035191867